ncbi:MAG: penicillin-binding protein 1A [Bryobacteraceae bacterium]
MPVEKKGMRVRVPREAHLARFFARPIGKTLIVLVSLAAITGIFTFTYFYLQYSRLIDETLKNNPFASTSRIYAAPITVGVGDAANPAEIATQLRRAGYNESRANPIGHYNVRADSVEIFPGTESYFDGEEGTLKFAKGKIARIVSLRDNTDRGQYELEPQLITNLYDRNREKRRIVKYADIPEVLRNAILSAEDKRFFQHSGFDPVGVIRAAYIDLKSHRNDHGASTLTMQLARGMWLTPDRNWRRKAAEVMITLELEQKLTKEEIFEFYCNQVDLGRRGTFTIRGFGEAAQAYFGKDIRQLTAPEAAMLAGILRGASYYNPFRHLDRVKERRNVVLSLMRQNGYISDREYAVAVETPLNLVSTGAESSDAPYFVDRVNDELQTRFENRDFQAQSYRIYTTLDLDLQRAANDAVRAGMELVDQQLKKQKRFKNAPFVEPQVALIALDPHTGEIKALVGGRNYSASQLDHTLAERQPGSIFKPFVYAAAMNTAINGGPRTLTPATTVVDEPTTFWYGNQSYEPGNFKQEYYGVVTLRRALAKSMNIATVKVAEMVGYNAVVNLAHKAGINEQVHATPSVALGAYEATPIEMAGAYTVFANQGNHVQPAFLARVEQKNGSLIYEHKPELRNVLDPRVDYLMVSLLEEVMRTGTAAGVRSRGFTVPAAGKTGTSRDGWFAGFTSELLCVVWVGFDDNRELDLEGARSALPIWTAFMKKALQYRNYRAVKEFQPPSGIVTVEIDPESGMPVTPFCPATRSEVFIAGTEPVGVCPLHGSGEIDTTNVSGWDNPKIPPAPRDPSMVPYPITQGNAPSQTPDVPAMASRTTPADPAQAPAPPPKKGLFRRLWGVVK